MKHPVFGILCAAFVLSTPVHAEPVPIRVNSMALGEGLQMLDGTGFYGDVVKGILENRDGGYVYNVTPFKRAVRNFRNGASDCIWALDIALLKDIGLDVSGFVESSALLVSSQRIFTRRDAPVISALEDLKGKRVGVLIGTNLETELEPIGAEIVELNSQEAKLYMLDHRRVDAVLGWMPDIAITAKRAGMAIPSFDRDLTVRTSGVGFVCHDNSVGRRFILEIDDAIASFQSSAQFETLKVRYLGMAHSSFGI